MLCPQCLGKHFVLTNQNYHPCPECAGRARFIAVKASLLTARNVSFRTRSRRASRWTEDWHFDFFRSPHRM